MLLPFFLPLISFHISHHQHFPTHPSSFPFPPPPPHLSPFPFHLPPFPPIFYPPPTNPFPSKLTIPPDGQLRWLRLGRPRLSPASMVRAAKIRAVKTLRADQKLWDSKVHQKIRCYLVNSVVLRTEIRECARSEPSYPRHSLRFGLACSLCLFIVWGQSEVRSRYGLLERGGDDMKNHPNRLDNILSPTI